MRTEGNEVHETTDEARAGSTPNIVRWVLAISLLGAIVLLSIIWMTGAIVIDGADDETHNVTDRIYQEADQRPSLDTDSIVSDRTTFEMGPEVGDITPPSAEPTAEKPADAGAPE